MRLGVKELVEKAKGEDNILRVLDTLNSPLTDRFDYSRVFELLEKFGVVPENIWKVKIQTKDDQRRMLTGIQTRLVSTWLKYKGALTDDIIDREIIVGEVFATVPPTHFAHDGLKYTSKTFLTEKTGFNSATYAHLIVNSPAGLQPAVTAVKRALADGIDVPIGIDLDNTRIKSESSTFSSRDGHFFPMGGHAMVVIDFVNKKGSLAALSPPLLLQEVNKSFFELDYLYLKNSYGTKSEKGRQLPMGGHWIMKRGYLEEALASEATNVVDFILPSSSLAQLSVPKCQTMPPIKQPVCFR